MDAMPVVKGHCSYARLAGSDTKYWAVRVDCPFCGKVHTHSGGEGEEPELGFRYSHCGGPLIDVDNSGEPVLVGEVDCGEYGGYFIVPGMIRRKGR